MEGLGEALLLGAQILDLLLGGGLGLLGGGERFVQLGDLLLGGGAIALGRQLSHLVVEAGDPRFDLGDLLLQVIGACLV